MKSEQIVTQVKKDKVTQEIRPEILKPTALLRRQSTIRDIDDFFKELRKFNISNTLSRQKRIQKISQKVDSSVEKKILSDVLEVKSEKSGFEALSQKEIKNNIQKYL